MSSMIEAKQYILGVCVFVFSFLTLHMCLCQCNLSAPPARLNLEPQTKHNAKSSWSDTGYTHAHTHTYTHRKPCLIPVKVSRGCYMFAVHFSPIKMRHWKFTGLSVAQWGHINTLVRQYVRTLTHTHTLQMLTLSDPCYHLEPGV